MYVSLTRRLFLLLKKKIQTAAGNYSTTNSFLLTVGTKSSRDKGRPHSRTCSMTSEVLSESSYL